MYYVFYIVGFITSIKLYLKEVQRPVWALHFFILFNHDTMLNSIEQKVRSFKFCSLSLQCSIELNITDMLNK